MITEYEARVAILMKVFLDDERIAPSGFIPVRWPNEAIELLKTGLVTHLSLDHDLGDDGRGTGYDVLLWLEENVYTTDLVPPSISIHSANSSARTKMLMAVESISRLHSDRTLPRLRFHSTRCLPV